MSNLFLKTSSNRNSTSLHSIQNPINLSFQMVFPVSCAALEACYLRAIYLFSHHGIYLLIQRLLWYLLPFFFQDLTTSNTFLSGHNLPDLWPVSLLFSGLCNCFMSFLKLDGVLELKPNFCIKQDRRITPTGYIPVDKSQ